MNDSEWAVSSGGEHYLDTVGVTSSNLVSPTICGHGSVGRAQPCQGWGRGFEPRCPLQIAQASRKRGLFLFRIIFYSVGRVYRGPKRKSLDCGVSGARRARCLQVPSGRSVCRSPCAPGLAIVCIALRGSRDADGPLLRRRPWVGESYLGGFRRHDAEPVAQASGRSVSRALAGSVSHGRRAMDSRGVRGGRMRRCRTA